MKKQFALCMFLAVLASCVCATAFAAAYPEKEVKLIVTQPAGGGTDAIARAVAAPLEKCLGKPLVIINQGSASGLVGITELAKARPDGYTIGVFSNTDNAHLLHTLDKVDWTLDDFTYIAGLNATSDIIVLRKDSPYKNLSDYIAAAKKSPGELILALPSANQNLSAALVRKVMDIDITPVVYEGGGKVFADLLGGHVDAGILSAKFVGQAEENGLVVLGIMLDDRLESAPGVPTFREQGYPILNPAIRMIVGPKGLPQAVIDVITNCLREGYKGDIAKNLRTIGEAPVFNDYDSINAFLKDDYKMRGELMKK